MSKFKNTEELEKAYKELEREFTKKSQKLAEVEKTNYVTLLHNEMDNLLNDYAKRRISDLEAKLAVADDCADRYWKQLGVVEDENEKLKQQLAEKDEKIDKLETQSLIDIDHIDYYQNEYLRIKDILAEKEEKLEEKTDALKELRQKCFEEQKEHLQETAGLYRELAEHNQDKKEFAIEQLNKVVDILDKNYWDVSYENWREAMAKIQTDIAKLIKGLQEKK